MRTVRQREEVSPQGGETDNLEIICGTGRG